MTIAMTMVMAMANLAIAVTMAMAMTMITITIAIVMIMAIAIPRPSHLKNKQTSKQTNTQMCMLPLFQSQIFSYLFCDQSSLVPFNYFVVLSMTLSRILILNFRLFFFPYKTNENFTFCKYNSPHNSWKKFSRENIHGIERSSDKHFTQGTKCNSASNITFKKPIFPKAISKDHMPQLVKVAGYERQQTSESKTAVVMLKSPHVRKSGFQNPGKFFAWNTESGKNIACGILNPGLRNPV